MGKQKSSVDGYFSTKSPRIQDPNSKIVVTKCKLCNYSNYVSDSSEANTSNLRKRLISKHLKAFQEELNIRAEREKVQKNNSERDISQFLTGVLLFAEMS